MTKEVQEITLKSYPKKLKLSFNGPEFSFEGGVFLLKQIDEENKISERLSAVIPEKRDPKKTLHSRLSQVQQRIYQIALGYEDCNDADFLRNDPLLKLACGRSLDDAGLSSQPTLSRFENAPNFDDLEKMLFQMEDDYVNSLPDDTELVILDVDATDDPVHGEQEGRHYNGYYKNYILHPLVIFDGHRGDLVSAILRTGDTHGSHGAFLTIKRIIQNLKARFPSLVIVVRGDCAFSLPLLHETLDQLHNEFGDIYYLLGQASNAVLKKKAKPYLEQAKAAYAQNKHKIRFLGELVYKADTWLCPRSIVLKVEETSQGTNTRYIIHNLQGFAPALLYDAGYCYRGQCENMIKDFKNALRAERLSCSSFTANFFRILLHSAAYRLMHALRNRVRELSIDEGRRQFDTLRSRLLKVPIFLKKSLNCISLQISTSFSLASLFRSLLELGLANNAVT